VLSVRNVSAGYGPIQVVRDVSIEVGSREIVCLIGSNGAGKTTLLRTISGITAGSTGTIEFNGVDLRGLPPHDVVTRGIAHVPEGRRLFRTMTVRENLLMGAYRQRDGKAVRRNLDMVYGLFPRLNERQGQAAGTLSGGEQQMCAVGRGLMSRPKLLLIDELSLGLAPQVVDALAETLKGVRDLGISILLVEQDVEIAFELATRGFLLDSGHIVLSGSTEELAENPQIKLSYVGG